MTSRTEYSKQTPKDSTLFSVQYLRNHWTLGMGVLGYIGIVLPKEHSAEVRFFPPGTPCIFVWFQASVTDWRKSSLFWDITWRWLVVTYGRFWRTCRSLPQSPWSASPLKKGPTNRPEISVSNYKATLRIMPEKRRSWNVCDVHEPVHRDTTMKITNKTHYTDWFNIPSRLYMFRTMFSPIIRSTWLYLQYLVVFTQVAASRQQLERTLPDTVNTVKCSWWWAKTLSETCRADLE
jgi:hypothetical protein